MDPFCQQRTSLTVCSLPTLADLPAAFTSVDAEQLQQLCELLGERQWKAGL